MSRRPLAGLPEVAAHFGMTEKAVRHHVQRRTGVGRLAFRVGRHLRWDWNDVDAWIESQKQERAAV